MPANLISCRPGSFGEYHAEAFEHLEKIGIRHVEIGVPPENEWPDVKAKLAKNNLSATSVSGGVDLSKKEEVAAFNHLAAGAKAFGAKIIFLSVKTGGRPVADCYAELRKLGDIAKQNG